MRLVAEFIGMPILVLSTGYGVYCLILKFLRKPRVIVVHDSKPDNKGS